MKVNTFTLKERHCLMWDETIGARGGNEIASSILKWADNVVPDSNIKEIT